MPCKAKPLLTVHCDFSPAQEDERGPKVWVLMGGEGNGRQAALAAGRAAYLALAGPAGDRAVPFLLAPFHAGLGDNRRRRQLLRTRNVRLKIGMEEEQLPRELQMEYIRCGVRRRDEP